MLYLFVNHLLIITHFFQKGNCEIQSYVINQVQVLVNFVPVSLFFLSSLANISNSNEEVNTFLLVLIQFFYIFALSHSPSKQGFSYLKLRFHGYFITSAPSADDINLTVSFSLRRLISGITSRVMQSGALTQNDSTRVFSKNQIIVQRFIVLIFSVDLRLIGSYFVLETTVN